MKRWLVLLLILLALLLTACVDSREKPVGEPVYFSDLQLIDGIAYYLTGENSLYRSENGQQQAVTTFSSTSNVVYGETRQSYYYIAEGTLYAYNALSGETTAICTLSAEWLLCATDNYVLAGAPEKLLIHIDTGTVTPAQNFPSISTRALDVMGDEVLFWHDEENTLCRYDCATDARAAVYTRERDPSCVMVCALTQGDTVYFAESQGVMQVLTPTEQTPSSVGWVAAMARDGETVILAAERNDVLYFYAYRDGVAEELAVWTEANYYLNGSCILRAADGLLVCTVTTGPELFTATY